MVDEKHEVTQESKEETQSRPKRKYQKVSDDV